MNKSKFKVGDLVNYYGCVDTFKKKDKVYPDSVGLITKVAAWKEDPQHKRSYFEYRIQWTEGVVKNCFGNGAWLDEQHLVPVK